MAGQALSKSPPQPEAALSVLSQARFPLPLQGSFARGLCPLCLLYATRCDTKRHEQAAFYKPSQKRLLELAPGLTP